MVSCKQKFPKTLVGIELPNWHMIGQLPSSQPPGPNPELCCRKAVWPVHLSLMKMSQDCQLYLGQVAAFSPNCDSGEINLSFHGRACAAGLEGGDRGGAMEDSTRSDTPFSQSRSSYKGL